MRKVVLKDDEWFEVAVAVAKMVKKTSESQHWQDLLKKLVQKLGGDERVLQTILDIADKMPQ